MPPRPVVVVASALSFRYEFSKQWKAHALRLLLDLPLNAYRRSSALRAGEPANDIVGAPSLAWAADYAFMLASICLVDFAFEARDRADFAKLVRTQARYASADSVVAAEGTRRKAARGGEQRDRARAAEPPVSGFFLRTASRFFQLFSRTSDK